MAVLLDLDPEAHFALRLLDDHPAPWLPDAEGRHEAKAVTVSGRGFRVLRRILAEPLPVTRYEADGPEGWVIWLGEGSDLGRVQVEFSGRPGDLAFDLFLLSLDRFGRVPCLAAAPPRAAAA